MIIIILLLLLLLIVIIINTDVLIKVTKSQKNLRKKKETNKSTNKIRLHFLLNCNNDQSK